jgi:hypothetical protein
MSSILYALLDILVRLLIPVSAVGDAGASYGRNRLSRNNPMLVGQVELGDAADNRATINHTHEAIIQAAINTIGNPSTVATALLTEETDIVLHSLYF